LSVALAKGRAKRLDDPRDGHPATTVEERRRHLYEALPRARATVGNLSSGQHPDLRLGSAFGDPATVKPVEIDGLEPAVQDQLGQGPSRRRGML
jgi:hypothetical protein